jgi:RNA polymerase sigma factor (sigma-70 family)
VTPATPEELFAGAYDEAWRMATKIVMGWYRGCRSPRWSDDLHSAAMETLWLCAVRFDNSRGVPFSHYWAKRVRGEMVDELRRLDGLLRPHRWFETEHPSPYRTLEDGDDRTADDPTPEDIAVANIAMEELEAAVATLPRDLRVAIDGCREGSTQSAVAEAEGVTGSAITLRKIVARRMLAGRLRVA